MFTPVRPSTPVHPCIPPSTSDARPVPRGVVEYSRATPRSKMAARLSTCEIKEHLGFLRAVHVASSRGKGSSPSTCNSARERGDRAHGGAHSIYCTAHGARRTASSCNCIVPCHLATTRSSACRERSRRTSLNVSIDCSRSSIIPTGTVVTRRPPPRSSRRSRLLGRR